jgi:hypothetical protein
MTKKNTDPKLIYSKHCQDVSVDGHRFQVNIISSDQDPEWCLEIVDEHAMSHVWETTFKTDGDALEAAMVAFQDEGAAGFLQPETNVVPFQAPLSNPVSGSRTETSNNGEDK